MDTQQLEKELNFRTSRSSGSGGQHVNKVNSRVELFFDLWASEGLSKAEKQTIARRIRHRMTKEGIIHMAAQNSRSQGVNKRAVIRRFHQAIEKALTPEKPRKTVKPLVAKKKKRLKDKKIQSEKKGNA